jgi:hypothetical protein
MRNQGCLLPQREAQPRLHYAQLHAMVNGGHAIQPVPLGTQKSKATANLIAKAFN